MRNYARAHNCIFERILEPSMGDGRFVKAFAEDSDCITCVEIDEEAYRCFVKENDNKKVEAIRDDFLNYAERTETQFDLIIGNPPYINIKNLEADFLLKAKRFAEKEQLPPSIIKNAWAAFVIASSQLVKESGTIFFVLPFEFLQVQYAEKLRLFLEQKFNTIHIICFDEVLFAGIEQETCLVYLSNVPGKESTIAFEQYESIGSTCPKYETRIKKNKPLRKWSNALLDDAEIDLLHTKIDSAVLIDELGAASPGIVTAANNYFILSNEEKQLLQCEGLTLPIISKSAQCQNTIILDNTLFEKLASTGKKVHLLNLKDHNENSLPSKLKEYLSEVGNAKRNGIEIKNGYKCSKRNPWYAIPLISPKEICFFKRYDQMPRFVLNEAMFYTTDIAYGLSLKEAYDSKSVVFCFYNSFTLAQCEYRGRFYGGGVLELTPSEFKSITIPYMKISEEDFKTLQVMFQNNISSDEIIEYVDSTIFDKKQQDLIQPLKQIRRKLMNRRLKR